MHFSELQTVKHRERRSLGGFFRLKVTFRDFLEVWDHKIRNGFSELSENISAACKTVIKFWIT